MKAVSGTTFTEVPLNGFSTVSVRASDGADDFPLELPPYHSKDLKFYYASYLDGKAAVVLVISNLSVNLSVSGDVMGKSSTLYGK